MAHVIFIHGIGNKPPADRLLTSWERDLATAEGIDLGALGIYSSMVYWADVLYPEAVEGGQESATEGDAAGTEVDLDWTEGIEGDELEFVAALSADLDVDAGETMVADPQGDEERIFLPESLKRVLMRALLRDVHHYLFNATHEPRTAEEYLVQDEIRRRTLEAINAAHDDGTGPIVILSHSMGTVVAYDVLKRVGDCPPVDGLITAGSPLGRHEVPYQMRPEWSKEDGFPVHLNGPWVNVYDRLDVVVGMSPSVCNLYRRKDDEVAVDVNEQNWGTWRHDIAKYLRGVQLRSQLAEMLELDEEDWGE